MDARHVALEVVAPRKFGSGYIPTDQALQVVVMDEQLLGQLVKVFGLGTWERFANKSSPAFSQGGIPALDMGEVSH